LHRLELEGQLVKLGLDLGQLEGLLEEVLLQQEGHLVDFSYFSD
jgi:hypothetical protein